MANRYYRCNNCKSIYEGHAIADADSWCNDNCPVCFANEWVIVRESTIKRLRNRADAMLKARDET